MFMTSDHLSRKPANPRECDRCQATVWGFLHSQKELPGGETCQGHCSLLTSGFGLHQCLVDVCRPCIYLLAKSL